MVQPWDGGSSTFDWEVCGNPNGMSLTGFGLCARNKPCHYRGCSKDRFFVVVPVCKEVVKPSSDMLTEGPGSVRTYCNLVALLH